MIVVSNAGPLIALARIHCLDILPALYGKIHVPSAVWQEIVAAGHDRAGTTEIDSAKWIRQGNIKDAIAAEVLGERLDAGESESIVLSLELRADVLLMDEERGRRIAVARGINVIGTLGMLVLAKQRKLVPSVTILLDKLIAAGFRMSANLYRAVLTLAGEAPLE